MELCDRGAAFETYYKILNYYYLFILIFITMIKFDVLSVLKIIVIYKINNINIPHVSTLFLNIIFYSENI